MITTAPELGSGMIARYERLTERAASIRTRRKGDRPTALVIVGAGLLSLGVVLVILGYQGASHTIYVFEQIPFLISGGILGGCCVIAGGFLYFAYWLTRLHAELTESRLTSERSAASLEHVEQLLAQLLEQQQPAPRPRTRKANA